MTKKPDQTFRLIEACEQLLTDGKENSDVLENNMDYLRECLERVTEGRSQ